jgi:hypothetical protein
VADQTLDIADPCLQFCADTVRLQAQQQVPRSAVARVRKQDFGRHLPRRRQNLSEAPRQRLLPRIAYRVATGVEAGTELQPELQGERGQLNDRDLVDRGQSLKPA